LVIWLTLMAVWIRYGFFGRDTKREKWKWIRSRVTVFSVPFFVLAFMFTLNHLMLPGLLVYFIVVNFLFLGFLHIPYAELEVVEPEPIKLRLNDPLAAAERPIPPASTQLT